MSMKLTDPYEVLYRHIHPDFFSKGEPSSNRFMPSKRDQNLLSVDRSSMVDAGTAHANYTADGKKCAAVFGVSVAEFSGENIECRSDPVSKTETMRENLAHALSDYSAHDKDAQKLIAIRLRRLAIARGICYQHES